MATPNEKDLNTAQKIEPENVSPELNQQVEKQVGTSTIVPDKDLAMIKEATTKIEDLEEDPSTLRRFGGAHNRQAQGSGQDEEDEEMQNIAPQKDTKKGSGGGFKIPTPGCGCKSISCYGCLLFLLLIVIIAACIYFRPSFVWNPLKSYLNNDYAPESQESMSASNVRDQVKASLEEDEINFDITEQEMQALIEDKLESDEYYIDIEPNYIRLVRDIDSSTDKPLWLIFEVGQGSNDELEFTKLGFEKTGAPGFLRDVLSKSLFSVLDLSDTEGENDAVRFVSFFLSKTQDKITVSNVRFDKDKITIQGK